MWIDTHCHLTSPGLAENLPDVMARAKAAGIGRMVTVGTHVEDHAKALALSHQYPEIFAALGIHPHHAAETQPGYGGFLEHHLRNEKKVVALGECGLDYHYGAQTKLAQRGVFIDQLEIARRLALPVILHVREAHADALSIMTDFPELTFVVHCFTGTPAECDAWLALNAYIGITGIVTYKNAGDVQTAAKQIPADKLLVETDAPFLSPEPVRKIKINEPAHLPHSGAFIAALRNTSPEDLAKQTTRNAAAFYGASLLQ